jgi:large subunit ribosomal protein L21
MEIAIIETGGKQYTVAKGDLIRIEKLAAIKGKGESKEYQEGDKVVFDKVLLVDDGKDTTIGTPYIASAKVAGVVEKIGRALKIDVIKYKQKSRYFKKRGHRQPYFAVRIGEVK